MAARKTSAEQIQRQIAECEARLEGLRAKLARIKAKDEGREAPASGLDLLWKEALPMARQRSSKHQCRIAWAKIPPAERPVIAAMVAALRAWNRCDQWRKDGCAYAPGLHRWIANRMWECPPEAEKPVHRGMSRAKPLPVVDPEEIADRSDIEKILNLKIR